MLLTCPFISNIIVWLRKLPPCVTDMPFYVKYNSVAKGRKCAIIANVKTIWAVNFSSKCEVNAVPGMQYFDLSQVLRTSPVLTVTFFTRIAFVYTSSNYGSLGRLSSNSSDVGFKSRLGRSRDLT